MTTHILKKDFWYRYKLDYLLLFIICLGIRLYYINAIDLWGDELTGFYKWNLNLITQYPLSIRRTPVYIIINAIYKSLIPTSWLYLHNFVPRIPALVFGVLTVIILYDAYKRYIGKVAAYIIGCFACASYPLIIYARESRVYSMTHFFVALYLWLFLSTIHEAKKWKIILFFISSILGFFTYPYLTFIITIFYGCLSLDFILRRKKINVQLFFISLFCYLLTAFILLLVMKSSFSSAFYSRILKLTPTEPSLSFVIFSLKSMLSYYSCNSYILVLVAFLFPFFNFIQAYRKKKDLNFIHIIWILSSTLMIGHIVVLFLTINVFNPRHIGFLVIPFLSTVSYGAFELYRYLKDSNAGKLLQYGATVLLFLFFIFAFSTRDFLYYMKTGINYHAGTNEYSKNIDFINQILDGTARKKAILFMCNENDMNYKLYHYRTQQRVLNDTDLKKKLSMLSFESDMKYCGFLVLNDIPELEIGDLKSKGFSTFGNKRISLILSNYEIDKDQTFDFIETYRKMVCNLK
ncbi:MAG: glycosyltransferase family 39 protein [Desulfobacterales bacterium]|nr:glycosyltransferase family 39 protein [Desulfobacterales bacterium]MDP6806667.1 glycosyltransferase family 39 protein [Desulfobacterales bacterium]